MFAGSFSGQWHGAAWPESHQTDVMASRPLFLEFFAGGGMARIGLDGLFECVFANDIDPLKCSVYRANAPADHLVEGDIWRLRPESLPRADLAWASFPCQDLSLAGGRRGLNAPRSGAFWGFWNIIDRLNSAAPRTIVIENVTGLMSSHGGRDFNMLVSALTDSGYRTGALVVDAALFSPQSRQRLFLVAHKGRIASDLSLPGPDSGFHSPALCAAVSRLPELTRLAWVWWRLPQPPGRNTVLQDLLEREPPAGCWRSDADTQHLLEQMAPLHLQRVTAALNDSSWRAGAIYRRIRIESGKRVQRAEIRYDGLAGCLRTPAGGSSKQLLLVTENGRARLRPLLAREAARLMGLSDSYRLPASESQALKVMGDGVSTPVVRWLGANLLRPLTDAQCARTAA